MIKEPLRWLAISDIHFGASHVKPKDMYDRLKDVVFGFIEKNPVDLITINGDYYDNAFLLNSDVAVFGIAFFHELLVLAKQKKISVRVIRGTYTHDRDQLLSFVKMARKMNVDFEYYTDVALDTIRGYEFLYLPDNLSKPAIDIMSQLREVDCIVGHGYCEHVLPAMISAGKHVDCWNADILIKYMRHVAIFGHVHTASNYKNKVYYTGSFDRLCHGEEEPKGCLYITIDGDKDSVITVPNPHATPHITVKLTKDTTEDMIAEVKDVVKRRFPVPLSGYLRIIGNEDRVAVKSILQKYYENQLVITDVDINRKQKTKEKDRLDVCFTTYTGDVITEENLASLLFCFIMDNCDDADVDEDDVKKGLEELKQEMKGG